MAQYPIKMLKDEQGKPFVPVVSASTITLISGKDLQTEMDKKLEADNIIAGKNITVKKDGNNCTIGGPDIMNNLTTDASNKGVLDAYQGKVLDDKISVLSSTIDNNKTNNDKDIKNLQDRATALESNKVDKTKDAIIDTLGYTPLDSAIKGIAGGIAELGNDGKVPASQLPAFVDDVLEYNNKDAFPTTGEKGKIYVATDTNLTYRWSGTTYTEISQSLALGETASTAFAGDKGKAAYDHAVTNKGSAFVSGLYKITTNSEGHVTGVVAVQKSDITALGVAGEDTTYENATQTVDGLMSAADKTKLDNLATVAISGSYNDLDNKPLIPTKVSELTNDKNYLITETDPTVPTWAKAATKPTYTAAEVGALPDTTKIPTKISDLADDSSFVTDNELAIALNGKQDTLTAGDNITIKNGVISATGSGDGNAVMLYHTWASSQYYTSTGEDGEFANQVLDLYKDGVTPIITLKTNDTPAYLGGYHHNVYNGTYILYSATTSGNYFTLEFRKMPASYTFSNQEYNPDSIVDAYAYLIIRTQNDVLDLCQISYHSNTIQVLGHTNKYPYTPTNDYHPATKKYVDDSIASATPNLPDNIVSSINNNGTDQVRVVVSETKPEAVDGYVDLWVNPKYSSYDSLVAKIEELEARIKELEDNQITFVQTGTM